MKFRPEADIYPLMSDEELRALAHSIDQDGQLEPISLYQQAIIDGRNRYLAMTKFCTVHTTPAYRQVTPVSPITWVVNMNERRRHLNASQKALAAAKAEPFFADEAKKRQLATRITAEKAVMVEAKLPQPLLSETQLPLPTIESAPAKREPQARDEVAKVFGISGRTVQEAKKVLDDGAPAVARAVASGTLSVAKAAQVVSAYPDKQVQERKVQEIAASKAVSRVKGLTGEFEWYTPRRYLDAAVEVMGAIDLDPASSERAQQHVQAGKCFTIEDDGLEQDWVGRVFLNPPYAMPHIKRFVEKLAFEVTEGHVSQAILLTNNATDTEWFHEAARGCEALCLTRGRISFLEASNGDLVEKGSPTNGQAFFYFGKDADCFTEVFSEYGIVMVVKR